MNCTKTFPVSRFTVAGLLLSLALGAGVHAQNQPATPVDSTPAAPEVSISKPAGGDSPAPSSPVADTPSSSAPSFQGQTSAGQSSSLGAVNGDYVLKPGDTIEMVVFREPDLNIRSRVGKDGMVQLPLLGEIKLGGLSVRNATSLVRQKYNADYLVEPQIYLNIASFNTRKFTIIGQVGKPGTYEFGGGEDLDLLEAIGMAGGFTRIADRGRVVIKRREGSAVKTLKVNAKKLADSATDRFEIQPGDVINVGESWY